MNVDTQISFVLDVSFQVCHLKVVVHPVDNEVWEPWGFSWSLEKFEEERKCLLSEVITKDLEAHESCVVEKRLSEESQAEVFNLIVGQVKVYK
jgi:hypothetical protein